MIGGILCLDNLFSGWPSIFFLTGNKVFFFSFFDFLFYCNFNFFQVFLGLVLCIFWFFLVADSPENQKCISQVEKIYIVEKTHEHLFKSKEKKVKIILKQF